MLVSLWLRHVCKPPFVSYIFKCSMLYILIFSRCLMTVMFASM